MEMDLDAIIAAAHRAQQSCDYRQPDLHYFK